MTDSVLTWAAAGVAVAVAVAALLVVAAACMNGFHDLTGCDWLKDQFPGEFCSFSAARDLPPSLA